MSRGQVRARAPRGRSLVGATYDVTVGGIAHGGHCVARLPEEVPEVGGLVVFVRHAIPGEQVRVRITEGAVGDRFVRGDAVTVLGASPERVTPPCPYAGPDRCGGCDFQHVDIAAQRRLKGLVVAEQLRRLASLDRAVHVEAVRGDLDGLRWRTRMRFHRTVDGALGLRKHRSSEVVPIADCRIQAPGAAVVVEGEPAVGATVTEQVAEHRLAVAADGFWQVHRGAPGALVEAVLTGASARPGDQVVDLYSGVGLFTVFLAEAVGPPGSVVAVEGHRRAAEHADANLAAYPWVRTVRGPVDRVLARGLVGPCDVVVLDPPREGARGEVVERVAGLSPRTVVYVACDPASFARDVAFFREAGYLLEGLRAFDLFPMTHHVEVVGVLSHVS